MSKPRERIEELRGRIRELDAAYYGRGMSLVSDQEYDRLYRELVELDHQVDWLYHLSPTGNHARWDAFVKSGYKDAPELTYHDIKIDLDTSRDWLWDLPVQDIAQPEIAALLRAKQRELDLQLELLRLRETEGFLSASIELFGTEVAPAVRREVARRTSAEAEAE